MVIGSGHGREFLCSLCHKLGTEFESASVYCTPYGNDVYRGEGLCLVELGYSLPLVQDTELCHIWGYYICRRICFCSEELHTH